MAYTKQQKIQLLVQAFESTPIRFPRTEGETDAQFVTRIVQERTADFRTNFIKNTIERQIIANTPKEVIDVSDL